MIYNKKYQIEGKNKIYLISPISNSKMDYYSLLLSYPSSNHGIISILLSHLCTSYLQFLEKNIIIRDVPSNKGARSFKARSLGSPVQLEIKIPFSGYN